MWQSLEEFDPWVVFPEGTRVRDVTCERKFVDNPQKLTWVMVPGKTHFPLNHEPESLRHWLTQRVNKPLVLEQNGFNYDAVVGDTQRRLREAR